MATAEDLVTEAWAWVGTPFAWQASLKGVGCDCKGLVWGVARELGLSEAESFHARVADYGSRVPLALLKQGMAATFAPSPAPSLGDVLLMRVAGRAQHLAIHAGDRVIHTYSSGPRQVISTPLAVALRAWPLDSAWRFKSLEG